jgi:anti-sigma regulatory factor (Ser/Thr protein kinase)
MQRLIRADDVVRPIGRARTWPLPADVGAPGAARDLLARHCRQWPSDVDDDMLATGLLLVTELVTNAVRHGEPSVSLRIDGTRRLHVGVSDEGAGLPTMERPDDLWADSGRGLFLVDALAADWGCDQEPGRGKTVWFEL